MKLPQAMDSTLITIPVILCTLILWKIIYNLRLSLPWRVNCWFCNSNIWVKYIKRNCWTCPKCDQYNGFTKDGDYNKTLCTNTEQCSKSPNLFQRSPPRNGLCKMCNINQQLKVTQLANFVPMNDKKYDEEIDSYRVQLEKAYKLCIPCKRVLQKKLHKEKESLLGSKLLETRALEKSDQRVEKQNELIKYIINSVSRLIAIFLLILVTLECHENAMKHKYLSNTIHNIKGITWSLVERIFSIIKMKTLFTFPSLKDHIDIYSLDIDIFTSITELNGLMQKALGGVVCFLQIVGHFWNINKAQYCIVIDLFWFVFVSTSIVQQYVEAEPLIMSLIKLCATVAVLLVYGHLKNKTVKYFTKKSITPKKIKNIATSTNKKLFDNEDISQDTDDDVSLSKFGLHNCTNSSNETANGNHTVITGRSFTPRAESLWSKPKHNSTFSVNSVTTSPKSLSDADFMKPSFNQYQKIEDSDSDLDESISSLCISSPKKGSSQINPVFALRKFTASPNFVVPMPLNRSRAVISPGKLGHSTSWVAGGYWGTEGERQSIFNANGSRSSSQSSGFESQTSSLNQRNVFSHPPSREESVCGEPEKHSVFERFQSANYNNNYGHPSFYAPVPSPVFPQMQYNGHVQIPEPRMAQRTFVSQNVYSSKQYAPNSMFKAPGGLIKLPRENFVSH